MKILAVVSDLHCGGITALCPPVYRLAEQGYQRSNPAQQWMWKAWTSYWQSVRQMQLENPDAELVVVVNGDCIEGFHHASPQVMSIREDDMKNLAVACLKPHTRRAARVYVTRGTDSHVGEGGIWDDAVATDIGAIPDKAGNAPAWESLRLDLEGVVFEFAHHGKGSGREHTRGSGSRAMAADLASYYWRKFGVRPPNYAIYSHIHQFNDTGIADFPVRVMTTGCWQTSTRFGSTIRPGRQPEIGGLLFLIDKGRVLNADPMREILMDAPETQKW